MNLQEQADHIQPVMTEGTETETKRNNLKKKQELRLTNKSVMQRHQRLGFLNQKVILKIIYQFLIIQTTEDVREEHRMMGMNLMSANMKTTIGLEVMN